MENWSCRPTLKIYMSIEPLKRNRCMVRLKTFTTVRTMNNIHERVVSYGQSSLLRGPVSSAVSTIPVQHTCSIHLLPDRDYPTPPPEGSVPVPSRPGAKNPPEAAAALMRVGRYRRHGVLLYSCNPPG